MMTQINPLTDSSGRKFQMTISLEALEKQDQQESQPGVLSYTDALDQLSPRHGFRTSPSLNASFYKAALADIQRRNAENPSNASSGWKWQLVKPVLVGGEENAHPNQPFLTSAEADCRVFGIRMERQSRRRFEKRLLVD